MLAIGNKKICSSCRENKSISAFNAHIRTKDKLQNACKVCKARMNRNRKYALSSGYIAETKAQQENKCAICGLLVEELVVDHDHKTNRLRALLCRKCNSLLGMAGDSVSILLSAVNYLKFWTEE